MQCHKPSPKSQFLWVQLQPSPHGSCSWQPGFPTLIIRITIPTPFIIIIKLFNAIILIKKNCPGRAWNTFQLQHFSRLSKRLRIMVCQSLGHFGPCHCHQGDNKQMLMSMHTLTCVYIHIFNELLPAIIYACAFEYVHLNIHMYICKYFE